MKTGQAERLVFGNQFTVETQFLSLFLKTIFFLSQLQVESLLILGHISIYFVI